MDDEEFVLFGLTHIAGVRSVNKIRDLPNSLQHLTFWSGFDESLAQVNFSHGLLELNLGDGFNHNFDTVVLPQTSSNDTSHGSISSQTGEFKQEPVQMVMKIQEEPHRPNPWHSTWHGHYYETAKWKPKRNHDFANKPNYGYNKSQRWDCWGQDSSSGESMMGSTFTTPTPSPKFTKDMMHGD